jgi:hypothetical protein
MFNKDVVLPGRMRRRIENPRILLLDCPLEYKKGESQTNVELTREEDWCVLPHVGCALVVCRHRGKSINNTAHPQSTAIQPAGRRC